MDSSVEASKKSGQYYRRMQKRTAGEMEAVEGETSQLHDEPVAETEYEPHANAWEDFVGSYYPSSDEEDDFEDVDEPPTPPGFDINGNTLESCLRYFALKNNATHAMINLLLLILREKLSLRLPKDARTLLRTSTAAKNLVNVAGGQFWYNGVGKCLKTTCRNMRLAENTVLPLTLSIDGLPFHKSGRTTFWPILANIHTMPSIEPMNVAIFCGAKKPAPIEPYIGPLVNELNELMDQGITLGCSSSRVNIKVRAIVADSPARVFIKGVACPGAKHGCLKCTVIGYHHPVSRTVCFPCLGPLRADAGFREGEYGDHHKERSPLLALSHFNIVEDVIIGDRLHLLDLGVMRKLLQGWTFGLWGAEKWSPQVTHQISMELERIVLPSEIHRKLRKLDDLKFWKGSEYSSFLHYASVVVLRVKLSEDAYNHFMLFHCAVTLLSSDRYRSKWNAAGTLLEQFVTDYAKIYGEGYVSSNVHNLLHVTAEVNKFGSLSTLSAYPFENALQHMKRLLRSGWKNLEQVINRLSELENFNVPKPRNNFVCYIEGHASNATLHMQDFKLKNGNRDGWFLSTEYEVIKFCSAAEITSSVIVFGKKLLRKKRSLCISIFFYTYFCMRG